MPVDFGTVIYVRVPQEPETMVANLICLRHDLRRLMRKMFAQEGNSPGNLARRKKEIPWRYGGETKSVPARLQPDPTQGDVEPLGNFLVHASLELVPTHVGQTRPKASSGEGHIQILSSSSRYTPICAEEDGSEVKT